MIKAKDLPLGTHFWALMDGNLVVIGKEKDGYYVCGGWECSIREEEFDIIELINFPKGYNAENLYYK